MLKEKYRRFNKECDYEDAMLGYHEMIKSFVNASIPEYGEFIDILRNWEEEILNSFKRPYGYRRLSNAYTENTNGKIRNYLRISNGLVNFPRFRKRVLLALSRDISYALKPNLISESLPGRKRGPYNKIQE